MAMPRQFKLLKQGVLAVALLFLSANMATHKYLAHSGSAKLIAFDHQVRRDLSRAERETLRTSVLSARGELVPNGVQEATGINWSQEIVVNSYPISHFLTQLQTKRIFLDASPVLNL
jgi:hypothetical protein